MSSKSMFTTASRESRPVISKPFTDSRSLSEYRHKRRDTVHAIGNQAATDDDLPPVPKLDFASGVLGFLGKSKSTHNLHQQAEEQKTRKSTFLGRKQKA